MDTDLIFKAVCAAVVLIMIVYYKKRERKVTSFIFGALTGVAALFLINKYGFYIGAEIPLNFFNISGSAVLGVPFVVCLVILKFL